MIYSDDCKKVIEEFSNLLPWDKGEVIKTLANDVMTEDEIFKYFIEGTGYVNYDDIDVVKEVIDQGYERDVLDELYGDDICEYLLDSSDSGDAVRYMVEHGENIDIAHGLSRLKYDDLEVILKYLWKHNTEECVKTINSIMSE